MNAEQATVLAVTGSALAFGLTGLFIYLRNLFAERRAAVDRRYRKREIVLREDWANFYGFKSLGVRQVRGNGILVLARTELYFLQMAPRREIIIPLNTVTAMSQPKSHLGKSAGVRLLSVTYRQGEKEEVGAWQVRDVDRWTRALKSACPTAATGPEPAGPAHGPREKRRIKSGRDSGSRRPG